MVSRISVVLLVLVVALAASGALAVALTGGGGTGTERSAALSQYGPKCPAGFHFNPRVGACVRNSHHGGRGRLHRLSGRICRYGAETSGQCESRAKELQEVRNGVKT
jgi:hypothetical protein